MRPIGLLDATAMVVGVILGASIFVQPSEINRHVTSVAGVLSVWIVAGVLSLFGALVCAELSSAFSQTGGGFLFLKKNPLPAGGFRGSFSKTETPPPDPENTPLESHHTFISYFLFFFLKK